MARKKTEETEKEQEELKSEKRKVLESAISQIEKTFGKEAIMRLGEKVSKISIDFLPTGILPLDIAIGIGGIPRGRVVEIFGPEASGKTMLSLVMAAETQKRGGVVAFIDAEHAFDPIFAAKLGVNIDDLYISQPDSGEQALGIAETLVRSGAIDIIIVDSVAALVPEVEIRGEIGEQQIGLQARLMSQALRKLVGSISKSKTAVIFINQLRQKIGVFYGNPETTTGGLALKFYASVRLDVRRKEQIKRGDIIMGNQLVVKVVKNKVAPPFVTATFPLFFDRGVPKEDCVFEQGLTDGVIQKSGSYYSYKNEKLGQGKEDAIQYLKSRPEVLQEIEDTIKNLHFGGGEKGSTAI